jgi:DNA repair photolyase
MGEQEIQFGTKEWAPHNFNFMSGCSNDCVYCYAKEMAIRFKRKTKDSWKVEEPVSLEGRSYNKKDGRIMIPSSHDITPGNIEIAISVIRKLLLSGNDLLIVTKPHYDCVKTLVDTFVSFRSQIQFRFTIGSVDSDVLLFWEPGAPDFPERLSSLRYAFSAGYQTTISCEPLLDDEFDNLYKAVREYVSGSIWVGKMNFPTRRVKVNSHDAELTRRAALLAEQQNDKNIIKLYEKYKDNPQIEWKESIKKVINELCLA